MGSLLGKSTAEAASTALQRDAGRLEERALRLQQICHEKCSKWIKVIDEALAEGGRLDSGAAQKLAGRLMWATQHLFYR